MEDRSSSHGELVVATGALENLARPPLVRDGHAGDLLAVTTQAAHAFRPAQLLKVGAALIVRLELTDYVN